MDHQVGGWLSPPTHTRFRAEGGLPSSPPLTSFARRRRATTQNLKRKHLRPQKHRKAKGINDLCLSERPPGAFLTKKNALAHLLQIARALKFNLSVRSSNTYDWILSPFPFILLRSLSQQQAGPQLLHRTLRTPVNTSKCLPEPFPLAIAQQFYGAEECHVSGGMDI